ncbi:MAG: hypothetical protein P8R45_10660, partial [Candidatus Binatia bacterium]|nr:hypothetical protein [Candidatus Binatia bacterium]
MAGSFSGIATSDLIEALRVAEKDLRSIDALGKVRIATPENRLRASQVVMARAPDAFRIEVLAPFGISYAVATDGETLAALSTQENILFRGPPDEQTIAEVIGIALSPRDMTSLLLGRPVASTFGSLLDRRDGRVRLIVASTSSRAPHLLVGWRAGFHGTLCCLG